MVNRIFCGIVCGLRRCPRDGTLLVSPGSNRINKPDKLNGHRCSGEGLDGVKSEVVISYDDVQIVFTTITVWNLGVLVGILRRGRVIIIFSKVMVLFLNPFGILMLVRIWASRLRLMISVVFLPRFIKIICLQ